MRYLYLGTCLFLILFKPCTAQLFISLNSLETMIDAEQVAMGESFVANRSGLTAFKQNPATLTGINYLNAYYAYRDNAIHKYLEKSDFFEFGFMIKSPVGVTNINYAKFYLGESIYTDMSGVRLGTIKTYDYTVSVNHGYQLCKSLSVGISAKWIDFTHEVTGSTPELSNFDSQPAIVGDIGLTYQFDGLFSDPNIKDSLILGSSLQNFGSDLKYTSPFSVGSEEQGYQMPRFFKIGFAYGFTAKSNDLPIFEYLLTGQYGRLLNPDEYHKGDTDIGGIGTKVRFWEVLEFNLGGYYQAFYSLFGNEDVLNIRYGIAVNLPFERLGWNAPLTAKVSYTHLPLNQQADWLSEMVKRVPVITAQISYNADLF